MNMEKFNNHGLDVINSRVCFALDDYEDEELQGQTNSKVNNKSYLKELQQYQYYLQKVSNCEELSEDEQKNTIALLYDLKAKVSDENKSIPADVITQFCNVIDSNKKFPELYLADKTETKKELCIRFATEEKMPKADIPILYPIEYLGYYDSEACQIILCPERIKKAPRRLKNRKINPTTSQEIYGMMFIHALSHALLDMISKIDTQESRFMDESIATMMTLFYYLQTNPNSKQYKTLLEWFPIQSNACMAGLEQFKMFENDKGLMKKYWAAWMERKSKLLQK